MADRNKYEVQYSSTTTTSYGQPGYGQPGYGQPGVIVNQPTAVVVRPQKREWNSGVFGCMDDMKICLCGWCCPLCLACQVATDLGESALVPCCVPNNLNVLRSQFRTQQGIEGTVMGDCVCATFCGICTLCQLKREVDYCKGNGSLNNPNN